MAIRAGIINGIGNQNQDKDFGTLASIVLPYSYIDSGFIVSASSVSAGRALIKCIRTNTIPNESIWVVVENTAAFSFDTTGSKKVWIEVKQTNINDATLNTDSLGQGIAQINSGASYPSSNFIPLASITAGVITDARPLYVKKGVLSSALASATTTDLSTISGDTVHITGTTTITSFGTLPAGTEITCIFDGILTLTHNATSLRLPTGLNITTQAGDAAIFESEGSGNWKCISYLRADGTAVGAVTPSVPTTQTTFVAGENIAAGQPVYVSDGTGGRTAGRVYRADALDATYTDSYKFLGFAAETITSGNSIRINISGIDTNQAGLTPGAFYYLSDTVGTISTVAGTNSINVGKAVSATSILINNYDIYSSVFNGKIIAGTTYTAKSLPTALNTTSTTYVKQKSTKISFSGIYRISFRLNSSNGSFLGYGQIFRNGVAYGTERAVYNLATFSEDLYFNAGDTIELWGKIQTAGASQNVVDSFLVQYSIYRPMENVTGTNDIG